MATRIIHQVRCRNPKDSQMWVDVAVIDMLSVIAPGGQDIVIDCRAKNAIPLIKDDTGDENGKGDIDSATRLSHMERVHGVDDPTQKFDIEVLDAMCLHPPTIFDPHTDHNKNLYGFIDGGQYNGAQVLLLMPPKKAIAKIVDNVGMDLAVTPDGVPSRVGHINLVTEKGNTDDKTDGIEDANDEIPPKELAFISTVKIDAISFKCPNGNNIAVTIPKKNIDEKDTTVMTTDPDTGEDCPPDNEDPHLYIGWPKDSDSQGTNIGTPKNVATDKTEPVNMGILWYIKKVSPGFLPWFWFATVQTPKAFSFFGGGGGGGQWGYRGFVLFNYYPVVWILSINFPLQKIGDFGSPSLDLCAREGNWDTAMPPAPSNNMAGFGGGPFGPFGLLPMTHVPLGPAPNASPYGIGPGFNIWDGIPNVWQLTGLTQPDRPDLSKPWNPNTNANRTPTKKAAEECALKFKSNWNMVVAAHNARMETFQPDGRIVLDVPAPYTQPPIWKWAVPWFDSWIGGNNPGYPPEGLQFAFRCGLSPGLASPGPGVTLLAYVPATSWFLDVDQLDPAVWDTSKMEFNKNPINYLRPANPSPVLWASEH